MLTEPPQIGYLLAGDPDEKITWRGHTTTGGKPIYGSRRTIAHLEYTDQLARKRFGVGIVVYQGAYNTGVEASAGTHNLDAVLDVGIPGVSWWTAQRFLRSLGWAAWYRYPPLFSQHLHMISLGYKMPVGIYIDGGLSTEGHVVTSSQVSDYYAHKSGLVGHVADNSWHPKNIAATIFNYPAWVRDQEDNMPFTEWPEKDRDALTKAVAKEVLNSNLYLDPEKEPLSVRKALATVVAALKPTKKGDAAKGDTPER